MSEPVELTAEEKADFIAKVKSGEIVLKPVIQEMDPSQKCESIMVRFEAYSDAEERLRSPWAD